MKARLLCVSGLLFATGSSLGATKVLQAFEGDGYGDWKTEGTAFGLAPIPGKMDGLTAELTGYSQDSLACSAHGGDAGVLVRGDLVVGGPELARVVLQRVGEQGQERDAQRLIETVRRQLPQSLRESAELPKNFFDGREIPDRTIDVIVDRLLKELTW